MSIASENATPLTELPAMTIEQRNALLNLMRDDQPSGHVRQEMSDKYGYNISSDEQLFQIYRIETNHQWETRCKRARIEADAIKHLFKKNTSIEFTEAMLTALGQEAFRLFARDGIPAEKLHQFFSLFLRARQQEIDNRRNQRAEKRDREKHQAALSDKLDASLKELEKELKGNESALRLFDAMQKSLRESDLITQAPQPLPITEDSA